MFRVDLNKQKLLKLKRAHDNNRNLKLIFNQKQLLSGGTQKLYLNSKQYKTIKDNMHRRKKIPITFNKKQVKKIYGGILPFIIPALMALGKAAALGATGGLASVAARKIIGKGNIVSPYKYELPLPKGWGRGLVLPGTKIKKNKSIV